MGALARLDRNDPDYRKVLACMWLGSLGTFAVLYAPQPLLTAFSREFGVSPATASTSISLPTLALALSLPFVPAVSRRFGRKRLMSLSLLATSSLAILSGLSHGFGFFLAVRFLEGLAVSGFPALAIAYLNEEVSQDCLGRTMGAYVAGTAVGGFVGRVAIGPLTEAFSWQFAFLVLGAVSLACSVVFWWLLPASRHFQPGRVSLTGSLSVLAAGLRQSELLALYGMAFLFMGAYITLLNYVCYPLSEAPYGLSQSALGYLFVVNLVGMVSSVLFGRLADRHPRPALMGAACLVYGAGATITLLPNLWVKIFGIAVFAFGFFACHTIASGWVGVAAPTDQKATASSLYLLFYYVGSGVVGWAGGYVWSSLRWGGVVGAVCLCLGACYGLTLLASRDGEAATSSA